MSEHSENHSSQAVYVHENHWGLFPKFYIFLIFHLLCFYGLYQYAPTKDRLIVFGVFYFLTACIGITLTYHRCLSHKAFEFRFKWMERLCATIGTLAMQQGPIWWSSIHRIHHRYSDTEQDPHDSARGFWYAHFLWLFKLDRRWQKPYKIESFEKMAKDLASDPYYRWLDRYFYIPQLLSFLLLYMLGGLPWLFWGGIIRTVVVWHVTWFVNSVTHQYGYRNFNAMTGDTSTNNWWVAILAAGEGWHNNHHAFPSSAKQGFFKWWEFDITYVIIRVMKELGLAKNLREVSQKQILSSTIHTARAH
ncbi:MAG: fatty acid desaturase [Deltaproteobacteria bacterium]|nr:fatty acid desaturase [Deltaproteobacteria bacterium]